MKEVEENRLTVENIVIGSLAWNVLPKSGEETCFGVRVAKRSYQVTDERLKVDKRKILCQKRAKDLLKQLIRGRHHDDELQVQTG